jgi:hypothetical protein
MRIDGQVFVFSKFFPLLRIIFVTIKSRIKSSKIKSTGVTVLVYNIAGLFKSTLPINIIKNVSLRKSCYTQPPDLTETRNFLPDLYSLRSILRKSKIIRTQSDRRNGRNRNHFQQRGQKALKVNTSNSDFLQKKFISFDIGMT